MERVSKLESKPKESGSSPEIWFFEISNDSKYNKSPRSCGIEPVTELSLKSICVAAVNSKISSGMTPLRSLLLSMTPVMSPELSQEIPYHSHSDESLPHKVLTFQNAPFKAQCIVTKEKR